MAHCEIAPYRHFGRALFLDNGTISLVIPLEFGIRILAFSKCGGKNVFFEQPDFNDDPILTAPGGFLLYGGHRLWLAPESDRSYHPDNHPISYELTDDGVIVTQPPDPALCVRKQMRLVFDPKDARGVHVTHTVTNLSNASLTAALWAISAMAAGGTETVALNPAPNGLLANRHLALWDYTDLHDTRFRLLANRAILRQTAQESTFKIGISGTRGEARYVCDGGEFVLRFAENPEHDPQCRFETFTCRHMLEMETLSPLRTFAPGQSHSHTEHWQLR